MPWLRHDNTRPLCPGVEVGPCTKSIRWAKLNMFKEAMTATKSAALLESSGITTHPVSFNGWG